VRELLTQLESKLRGNGTTSRGFNPHVTLFYDTQIIEERAVEPIALQVREIVMVHNRLGTGLPYEILGRWPLHLAHASGRDPG
jgi:2'-5' RNA ligase